MAQIKMDREKLNDALMLLGKRIIPCYLYEKNPVEMRKWQFNCCMQTAMTVAWFMKMQQEHDPSLRGKIHMFEGEFKAPDHIRGESYNHAWVFVEGPGLFIDVARVTNPCRIVYNSVNDPGIYYPDMPISKRTHDWMAMGTQPEYYTHKMGLEFISEIMNLLALYTSPGALHGLVT